MPTAIHRQAPDGTDFYPHRIGGRALRAPSPLRQWCWFVVLCVFGSFAALAIDYRERPRTWSDPAAPPHQGPVTIAFWNIEEFTATPIKGRNQDQVTTHVREVATIIDRVAPTILLACEIRNHDAALGINRSLRHP